MEAKPRIAAIVLLLSCHLAVGDGLDSIVPADAVAFVELANTEALRSDFEASALGAAIRSSKLLSYLRTAAGAGWAFAATLATGLPAEELRQCLGERVAVALLDFKSPADLKARVPVVLILEAADPGKLQEALAGQLQLFSSLQPGLDFHQSRHGETKLYGLTLPGGPRLALAVVGKAVVAGTHAGVAALLDARGDRPRLRDHALYASLRKRLGGDGLFAYVNVRALKERSGIATNPVRLGALAALGLSRSEAAALAIGFDRGQVRERLFIHTGPQPTGLVRMLTAGRPVRPTAVRFVPKGYTALALLSLRDVSLWDRLRTMLAQAAGPGAADFLDKAIARVQQQNGINIKDDILETFGDEAVLAIDLRRLKSFFGAGREPLPEELPILFAARLAKPAVLAATLDKLAASQALWQQGVERKAKRIGNRTLYSFSLPLNPDLRPSYLISEESLLASVRPEPVAAALEAPKAPFTLKAPPPARPVHAMVQVDDAALLSAILDSIRDELPPSASRFVAELDALIAHLHGYQATLRREENGVLIEAHSDLGTLATFFLVAVLFDQGNAIVARRVERDFDKIANALENYRKQKGHYPETLDQLVPDFLPEVPHDRFLPRLPYAYSRGKPNAQGQPPDAWLLTSVGPDKRSNIPVDQFDPVEWSKKLRSTDPADVQLLKRLIYRFHPERYRDERKNDDEGDIFRMSGRGLRQAPKPAPVPPKPAPEPADDNF